MSQFQGCYQYPLAKNNYLCQELNASNFTTESFTIKHYTETAFWGRQLWTVIPHKSSLPRPMKLQSKDCSDIQTLVRTNYFRRVLFDTTQAGSSNLAKNVKSAQCIIHYHRMKTHTPLAIYMKFQKIKIFFLIKLASRYEK